MNLAIRLATAADIDVLMSLLDAAAARHARRPWPRAYVERSLREDQVLLGYEGESLVATATLQGSDIEIWGPQPAAPRAVYLHRLASSIPARGLGAAMLAACERWAGGAGADVLRLDCSATNARLNRYYLELGYSPVGIVNVPGWSYALFEKKLLRHKPKLDSLDKAHR